MHSLRPTLLLAACTVAVACSSERKHRDLADEAAASATVDSAAGIVVSTDSPTLEANDVSGGTKLSFAEGPNGTASMSTRSGALVMSLGRDSIVVAFSDSIRRAVKREVSTKMNKDKDKASGFGEVIQGVVEKSVSATMSEVFDKSRGFPLSSLRDVSYEDGAIHFDFREKPTWNFNSIKTDHTPLLEQFHPADAARFVGAVRARLRQS